jgi:malonyl-CoA decarboxylase
MKKILDSVADAGLSLWRSTQGRRDSGEKKRIVFLCGKLYSNKGEALGTALAREVVDEYSILSDDDKVVFFQHLVDEYSVDKELIVESFKSYAGNTDINSLASLRKAIESPRMNLFHRINLAPEGTKTLIGMRDDLAQYLKPNPDFKLIDEDLKNQLISWFNRGFLTIQSIDWKTPAHILEKLIAYEAVHKMGGWDDLRRRLEVDRRCFAFFHPALPDEPLIFVEVALTNGLAPAIQPLLEKKEKYSNVENENTAIFYSISNCQSGLRGISFGNFLIKQVVLEIKSELPQIKNFATLSPIPGFKKWLDIEMADTDSQITLTEKLVVAKLGDVFDHNLMHEDEDFHRIMMKLCSQYLYLAKKDNLPLDPVARFHLGNGASIEKINWCGDTSENGFKQSASMLVNYSYNLKTVESNHEEFVNNDKISVSKEILKIIKN